VALLITSISSFIWRGSVDVWAVHPDKVGHDHPGANQAAGRVNKVSLWHYVLSLSSALCAKRGSMSVIE
jgi:hypothetical protein